MKISQYMWIFRIQICQLLKIRSLENHKDLWNRPKIEVVVVGINHELASRILIRD